MEEKDIRKLYKGQKTSLYQLSKKANVPVAMLYDTASQKRKLKNARVETALRIAKVEGITVEELLDKAKEIGVE